MTDTHIAPRWVRKEAHTAVHLPLLYPFKGAWYFTSHRAFWPLLKGRLLPALLLSIAILTLLFLFLYLPQVAFLTLFHKPGSAWVNGTFLVLGEGSAIVAILFECFFVDETQVDIFDGVLVDHGLEDLVQKFRNVLPTSEVENNNPVKRLCRPLKSSVYLPFSFRQIIEFVLLLPLNFVPYIGVPAFLFLTGYRAGPLHHHRYFKMLEFHKKERNKFLKRRKLQYTQFGMVGLCLQLIPGLDMLTLLTTAAGSALWVVKLENERRVREGQVNGDAAASGVPPDEPPPYTDDAV